MCGDDSESEDGWGDEGPGPQASKKVVSTLLANDPGARNIIQIGGAVYPHTLDPTQSQEPVMRYTRVTAEQYRVLKHDKRRLERALLRTKGLQAEHDRLSKVSHKTASLDDFLDFAAVFSRVKRRILEEKLKPRWAREKFRAWRAIEVVLSTFTSGQFMGQLEDGNLGLPKSLGFGDAKFRHNAPGKKTTPTTAIEKAFVQSAKVIKGCEVAPVNEFRTSIAAPCCTELLADVKTTLLSNEQARRLSEALARGDPIPHWMLVPTVNGAHYCVNPGCPDFGRRMKNRDKLADCNLLQAHLAQKMGLPRPAYLDRNSFKGKAVRPPPIIITDPWGPSPWGY